MLKRVLGYRAFPWMLATLAVIFMLPALWSGLLGDDLIQRLAQFKREELPPRILETGFVPEHSGQLTTVLCDLFGYLKAPDAEVRARDYGISPWWAHPHWRAALFRPVTAFTHWFDYRLFPNTPMLMHAHSILWYAAAVFLAATAYRKIAQFNSVSTQPMVLAGTSATGLNEVDAAAVGLAGCLFLLDPKTYFPVMYVANRGFFIALVFGLLCLHAHLQWRITRRVSWMLLSAACLLLSLLANEAGVSTLAFLIPCALLIESGRWGRRLFTLVPAASVVVVWRAVYAGFGFGVRNFTLYIDPGYEPLSFLRHFGFRALGLLGGQLSGLAPEIALALSPTARIVLAVGFTGFSFLCTMAFLPVLRRNLAARFWTMAMLLAVVPAATVYPISKNMGFIAVGAFGVVACLLASFARKTHRTGWSRPQLVLSSFIVLWLLVANVPCALAARVGLAVISPKLSKLISYACSFQSNPDLCDREVMLVNDPTFIPVVLPFDYAYRGLLLPKAIYTLLSASVPLQVYRPDASTLVITAIQGDSVFDTPKLGPLHLAYVSKAATRMLFAPRIWKAGERATCRGFEAEVLKVNAAGDPRAVAFHFRKPLQSEDMVWLFFDWSKLRHSPFVLPKIGETIEIPGAS